MMPHPERASELLLGSADGRLIFESLVHALSRSREQDRSPPVRQWRQRSNVNASENIPCLKSPPNSLNNIT